MLFLQTLWSFIKEVKPPFLFLWKTELLWRQCRGVGHHLVLKVESCGFRQVAVGNSWFLLSNYGDDSEPLWFLRDVRPPF